MFQLLFGSFLLRELPVPFSGHHDITAVWGGSKPPAFAAQPHALVRLWFLGILEFVHHILVCQHSVTRRGGIVYTTAFSAYKQAHSKFFFASLNNHSTRFSNSPSGISIMSFICTCILSFAKE